MNAFISGSPKSLAQASANPPRSPWCRRRRAGSVDVYHRAVSLEDAHTRSLEQGADLALSVAVVVVVAEHRDLVDRDPVELTHEDLGLVRIAVAGDVAGE
jgi:hypothetical protein